MSTHLPRFQSFFSFLYHFVLAQLAASSIRVRLEEYIQPCEADAEDHSNADIGLSEIDCVICVDVSVGSIKVPLPGPADNALTQLTTATLYLCQLRHLAGQAARVDLITQTTIPWFPGGL